MSELIFAARLIVPKAANDQFNEGKEVPFKFLPENIFLYFADFNYFNIWE